LPFCRGGEKKKKAFYNWPTTGIPVIRIAINIRENDLIEK
jgi:hypothetical protein